MKYVYTKINNYDDGGTLFRYTKENYDTLLSRYNTLEPEIHCWVYNEENSWEDYYTRFIGDTEKVVTLKEVKRFIIERELSK